MKAYRHRIPYYPLSQEDPLRDCRIGGLALQCNIFALKSGKR